MKEFVQFVVYLYSQIKTSYVNESCFTGVLTVLNINAQVSMSTQFF